MAALGRVLLPLVIVSAVLAGLGKMVYEMNRLASQPPRRRQPWEVGPR
jgi:hypothetical protein